MRSAAQEVEELTIDILHQHLHNKSKKYLGRLRSMTLGGIMDKLLGWAPGGELERIEGGEPPNEGIELSDDECAPDESWP